MLINDHINFSGRNLSSVLTTTASGPRFPDMSNAYDREFRNLTHRLAKEMPVSSCMTELYLMVSGPNFETAAEIRAFQILGAHAVGIVNRAGSLGRRLLRNQSPRLLRSSPITATPVCKPRR
ncbi:MAG: hypothetical protein ACLU99_09890 [Alphaproteobacteria bacterium]